MKEIQNKEIMYKTLSEKIIDAYGKGTDVDKIEELLNGLPEDIYKTDDVEKYVKYFIEEMNIKMEVLLKYINLTDEEIEKIKKEIEEKEEKKENEKENDENKDEIFNKIPKNPNDYEIKKEEIDGKEILMIVLPTGEKYKYAEQKSLNRLKPLVAKWKMKNIEFIKAKKEELEKLEKEIKNYEGNIDKEENLKALVKARNKRKKIKELFKQDFVNLSNKKMIKEFKKAEEEKKRKFRPKTVYNRVKKGIGKVADKVGTAAAVTTNIVKDPEKALMNGMSKGIDMVAGAVPGGTVVKKVAGAGINKVSKQMKNMFK
jgi:DNA repair exonuclease SbcCD ATPase subunit